MNEYEEATEDIEDERVLRMVQGCFKDEKRVPRINTRVDMKRFKTRGYRYNTVINGTAIEPKEDL